MSCPFKQLHTASPPPTKAASAPARADAGCSVNKLFTFIQGSPDAAFLLDQEGMIVFRNKAAQLMFLTNVNQMRLCSIFSFDRSSSSGGGDCWDDIASSLPNSEPQHHDIYVLERDGSKLSFRMNLVKLPVELMGDANSDVIACAYVTPAHDHEHQNGVPRDIHSISEKGTNDDKLLSHLKDVVRASIDPMFCLRDDGTIRVANDPAAHLFGYTHEELAGKDIASICTAARQVQNVLGFMHFPSLNSKQHTTATDKSGREISVELGLSLNHSFACTREPVYFAHMKDLTAIKRHEAEIEHKDTLCQAMINASFDPMFGIDQRGKILVVNDSACQAFGYKREEFLDRNISMICNERDAVDHDRHLRRYIRSGEKRVIGKKRPLVARRKDGTEFHIELGVSEVNLENGEKMFCGYVRDRTQERLDKQMLRRKDAVIQDQFFQGLEAEDARGAQKRNIARFMQ